MDVKLDEKALEAAQVAWLKTASDDYTRLDKSIAAAIRAYLTAAPAAPPSQPVNGELLAALKSLEAALRNDSRDKSICADTVEYHLDGQSMYMAINSARAAIARAEANAGSRSSERGGA